MADLPDPCAQALSFYLLVASFYNPCWHNNNKKAVKSEDANPSRIEKWMNSLGTIVCESMFIAIYTTPKIQLNMPKLKRGRSITYIVA